MVTNPLLLFLQEFFKRLATKSPLFFRIIYYISAGAALVTGLPGLLQELNVDLPEWMDVIQNKIIAIASSTAFVIAKLTTQSTAVAVTPSGEVLKKTNEEKLPFTAATEQKAAEKADNLPTSKVAEDL